MRIGSGEGKDVSGREYDAPSAAARSVSSSPSRDDDRGPSNNLRDTRTKKKVIEEVKEGAGKATRSFITNKLFDKFGKVIGVTPFGKKGAAILGILNAIKGSTKKSLPGNLSMLDEEGILGLPESNLFADVSAKDLKRKGMIEGAGFDYGDAQMMNMINPTMTQEEFEGMMKGTITEPTGKFAAAGGGRVGLKEGLFPFPMKKDGFLMSPDTDKLTEEQKMYMEGMKIQEKKRQEALKKFLDNLLESQPESERGLKPVPMPKYGPDDFKKGLQSLAGGGRVGFKKGLLASMMEGLSPDGGIFQSIFANRKHPILSTFNATELLSIGEALGPLHWIVTGKDSAIWT